MGGVEVSASVVEEEVVRPVQLALYCTQFGILSNLLLYTSRIGNPRSLFTPSSFSTVTATVTD